MNTWLAIKDINQAGPNLDGLLGFEFLRQFQLSIDFNQKKMYLEALRIEEKGVASEKQ